MDSTDDINQQLDDMLLDDLVDAEEELDDSAGTGNLTPGQSVYEERREKIVNSELTRLAEELGIEESTRTTAKSLFDQFANKKDIHGHALEVLTAACLYTACKVESVPLSPDDFAAVPQTGFTRVILLRRVKEISHTLGLDPSAFFDPHGYIDRYCDELGLSEQITERAHKVIDIADEAGIGGGKSPTGRAAAAIYNAVLDNGRVATQSDIANVADVTEVTIRSRYQEQRELLTEDTDHHLSDDSDDGTPNSDDTTQDDTPERDGPTPRTGESEIPAVSESTDTIQKEVSVDSQQEVAQYIGDAVAENIATALGRLDDATEELEAQTWDVCQRINDPQPQRWFGTDEVTLALAIIRFASEELGDPIPRTTLEDTLDGGNYQIYHVTKIVAGKVEQR
ncbi:transcription initiation factor IIB family protein [Halorubrum ezzemoulense]|uniref:transcription initiation factor IIB family protein n=1 Tax=Halorubrum ezzemoulense TaxID=337243 RepID=UPI00232C225D|nr:transcription initiation factor IIB family protein [Halorubrum ezzemoulense]MDB9302392.1 transcription initiation factor IIB family protein [Halorubrum ezzemoulense]